MNHPDELTQAIRDKQFRYHHQAHELRFDSHPVREWLGDQLIHLGETIRGQLGDRPAPTMINPPQRHAA